MKLYRILCSSALTSAAALAVAATGSVQHPTDQEVAAATSHVGAGQPWAASDPRHGGARHRTSTGIFTFDADDTTSATRPGAGIDARRPDQSGPRQAIPGLTAPLTPSRPVPPPAAAAPPATAPSSGTGGAAGPARDLAVRPDQAGRASRSAERTAPAPNGLPERGAATGTAVVRFAMAQLGKPYRWGSSGPYAYDCSGLVAAAWATAGVRLPRNAAAQYHDITHISRSALRPGDLVFFYGSIRHVGIYVGDGLMIDAPHRGERVNVRRMDIMPIAGYGRPGAQ